MIEGPGPYGGGLSRRDLLRGGVLLGAGAAFVPLIGSTSAQAALLAQPAVEPAAAAPVKTRTTYYTAEKVAAARRNIDAYSWAGQIRDTAVTSAQPLIDAGDEWAWSAVTTQGLPRSYAVNQTLGSPITGTEIYKYGNYPWLTKPYEQPWKLTDPSSDYVFPTNDFASYYASGLDANGQFSRANADPRFLVNELYPERGEKWGVDDGYGWIDEAGHKWTFAAYYNHWWVWYGTGAVLYTGLQALRDAYVYTGDVKYAHLGLIVLDRIADLYPSMDTAPYKREDGYLHSDGLTGKGKVIGSIWETGLARGIVSCYDAFYPAIASGDDAGVVEFLNAKATALGLPAKDSPEAIRANIETGILRQVYPAVQGAKIRGNFGMHQSTLALAAVVLDEQASAKEWLDFVFAPGGLVQTPDWHVTGGDIGPTLISDVDRDGWGNEGAPGYNVLWIGHMQSVADILDGYDTYPSADLYDNPKYQAMFAARPSLTMLGRYTPSIGDTGQTGKPGLLGSAVDYVTSFERYRDPVFAQMAYLLNGNSTANLYGGIFSTDVDGVRQAIEEVIAEQGPLALPSRNDTGFGFAALRAGSGTAQRGLTTYYGRSGGHGHRDTLVLGLYGFGVDLAPALGYPEFADNNARRHEWESNTVASNTVVVDAKPQATQWVGWPRGFAASDHVQLVDTEAPAVYSQTSLYRRSSVLVNVDAENSYVVDVFRIRGGSSHHFSFHGAEGPVTTEGLTLVAQPTGTYAGPDIEQPDPAGKPRPNASGFDWLGKVERAAKPAAGFAVDWAIRDTYGVHDPDPDLHLRLTMLTSVEEAALADGVPPRNKPGNPASLRYLLAKRAGTNLRSQFVSVLEPYVGSRFVRSVRSVPVRALAGRIDADDVAAVRIELTNGAVDYIVHSLRPDVLVLVDGKLTFKGAFGACRLRGGEAEFAVASDAQVFSGPGFDVSGADGALTGKVVSFTQELEVPATIELALDRTISAKQAEALVGSYVYVEDDGVRNAVYEIEAAEVKGTKGLVLRTGVTLIRAYADEADPEAGFLYDVAVGRKARIPLLRKA
ncbi:heparinase II/III family protein [Flindersiella endophytica]